jgi:hypothetical protein
MPHPAAARRGRKRGGCPILHDEAIHHDFLNLSPVLMPCSCNSIRAPHRYWTCVCLGESNCCNMLSTCQCHSACAATST